MQDTFGRTITYLRISITDRCNLRCIYCMPEEGVPWIPSSEIMRYEEIALVVRAMCHLGAYKYRITGGEPLTRKEVPKLVAMLKEIPGVKDIALSTNGILLAAYAKELAGAGLNRINVSLDTLRPDRFERIARRRGLDKVFEGLYKAEEVGLYPIKVNMVVMRGFNDDEIEDFARLTLEHDWQVRFIELMPLESNTMLGPNVYVSCDEILSKVMALGDLEPLPRRPEDGPSRYFHIAGAKGNIGVISPLSHTFCAVCNRVRLTAQGKLRLCLFGDAEVDLKTPIRNGAGVEEIKEIIQASMAIKPERHFLIERGADASETLIAMSQVGG